MNDNSPKTKETSQNKVTKDYGVFGKLEVIDLSEEGTRQYVLGLEDISFRD